MKITTYSTFGNPHEYEIVNKIPSNFFVWNIGNNMGDDSYIPICEKAYPGGKNCYDIKISTLKAIKLDVEEVLKLRNAAGYGIVSLATAEKALNSKRKGYLQNKAKQHANNTIEIFRRISE